MRPAYGHFPVFPNICIFASAEAILLYRRPQNEKNSLLQAVKWVKKGFGHDLQHVESLKNRKKADLQGVKSFKEPI